MKTRKNTIFCAVGFALFFQFSSVAIAEQTSAKGEATPQLALPVTDLDAPAVAHTPPSGRSADGGLEFSAQVTDNVAVKSVVLFYRSPNKDQFQSVFMSHMDGTNNYTVKLSDASIPNDGIEYYIKAEDSSGNTLLHGFSFSPIVLSFKEGTANVVSDPSNKAVAFDQGVGSGSQSIWKNKWFWIGIGVAAVAVASSGGSDSGGSTSSTPSSSTGSISITGPKL